MPIIERISIRNIWLAGIAVNIAAAWFSAGYYHADEHFQLLEYASFKMGLTDASNLPWEFHAGMRPAMQVFIAWTVSSGLHFLNPFNTAFILRLLSMGLALLAVYQLGKTVFTEIPQRKIYYLVALFLWFMPYQYVRFSSENWSGFTMLLAVVMVMKNRSLFHCGMLAGLSFCFRYQAAFFVVGLFFWLILVKKAGVRQIVSFTCGFLILFLLGIVSDYWLYGKWVLSSYQYFYINLVEDKAAQFGTEPFYYYFNCIIEKAIAPIGLLLILSFLLYIYKQAKSIFTWVALPFFVLHCLIAHKELRFLFPLVYFVPVFLSYILTLKGSLSLKPATLLRVLLWALVILNCLLLPFSSFKASNPRISLLKHLYRESEKPVCLEKNPYLEVHWFSYYFPEHFNPKNLVIVDSMDNIRAGEKIIIPSFDKAYDKMHYQMVYRQVPEWTGNFNYGHWLERSNFWCMARKEHVIP